MTGRKCFTMNADLVIYKKSLLKCIGTIVFATGVIFHSYLHADSRVFKSDRTMFRAVTLIDGLEHPWAVAFLPSGNLLITERSGRLLWFKNNKLHKVSGLPKISVGGQGGLLDVALHPDYLVNKKICFSYSAGDKRNVGTEIACGNFDEAHLSNLKVIFRAVPKSKKNIHFGSRLLFTADGDLYATLGDRGYRFSAQDLGTHPGSVIRIRDDGSTPQDNPFLTRTDAQPEIFAYGNRNPQGIAFEPDSDRIWIHEHGPRGGDELNVLSASTNYGWPVISFGSEYMSRKPVGEGTHKFGMQQPVFYWIPSIAPSGMTFYDGDKFPKWRVNVFIGSLKFKLLVRLELDNGRVVSEERLLENVFGRIRDVREGPDGFLYLLTDEKKGKLIRLEPLS